MLQCVVIADEITGASSVGSMLEKNRCKVCSLINSLSIKDTVAKNYDCLVYSTNSRNLAPDQSYQLVYYSGRLLKNYDIKLYAKRIDPSMRGNTCTETQALLDALGDNDRIAIVVPAFPALKRSNVGGYILIDGRPLQKSLIGLDDMQPTGSGRVADLFIEKFKYKAEALYLKEFLRGTEGLAERFKELAAKGVRAIVLDCTSQEEINMIADAVILSGIKFLAVDPGPFTATLARKVMRNERYDNPNAKIFGVVGGNNPLISAQVETLRLEDRVHLTIVRTRDLISDIQKRTAEIDRVVSEIIKSYQEYNVAFAVSDRIGASAQQIKDFEDYLAKTNRSRIEVLDIMSSAYGQIA